MVEANTETLHLYHRRFSLGGSENQQIRKGKIEPPRYTLAHNSETGSSELSR